VSFSDRLRPVSDRNQGFRPSEWSTQTVIDGFSDHKGARRSLRRLKEEGCDVFVVFLLLHNHSIVEQMGVHDSMDFPKALEQGRSLQKRLLKTADAITESLRVDLLHRFLAPMPPFPGIESLVPLLRGFANAIDALARWEPKLFDRRSAPSANAFVAMAHAEIKKRTGKHHYGDIANVIEAAYLAGGVTHEVNVDTIRNLCRRHAAGYRQMKNIVENGAERIRELLDDPAYRELESALLQLCDAGTTTVDVIAEKKAGSRPHAR
jgi:hypothetical protein